ncbi:MAG: hypothetical protein Q4B58_05760 [Bacteroidales bacterium]|nr:hypothetical protein [Bacteroidales bacterium]
MKVLKYFGSSLIASLCCGMAACAPEPEDIIKEPDYNDMSQFKVCSSIFEKHNSSISTYEYAYDAQKRMTKRKIIPGYGSETLEISYSADKILVKRTDEGEEPIVHTCRLENGRIVETEDFKISYDGNGHVISIGPDCTIVWNGDNIKSVSVGNNTYEYEISNVDFVRAPMWSYSQLDWDNGWLLRVGLLGKCPRYAPKSYTTNKGFSGTFSYETKDQNGYVTKCLEHVTDEATSVKTATTYTLTWK